MCAYICCRYTGHVSVKLPNCNVTGGRFRSYVLWVISHNHLQSRQIVKEGRRRCFTARFLCATPVRVLGCSQCLDTPMRINENTDNPFRSSDLGVMSPARCLCAMSVKCLVCVNETALCQLLIHIYIQLYVFKQFWRIYIITLKLLKAPAILY